MVKTTYNLEQKDCKEGVYCDIGDEIQTRESAF